MVSGLLAEDAGIQDRVARRSGHPRSGRVVTALGARARPQTLDVAEEPVDAERR